MRMALALVMISVFLEGCGVLTYGAVAAGGGTRTRMGLVYDLIPPVDEDRSRVFFFGDNTRYVSRSEPPWQPNLNINGSPFPTKYGTLIAFCVDLKPGSLRVYSEGGPVLKKQVNAGEIYFIRMGVSGKSPETYKLGLKFTDAKIALRMIKDHTFTGSTLGHPQFQCLPNYIRRYIRNMNHEPYSYFYFTSSNG